jgi:hypothetical protein
MLKSSLFHRNSPGINRLSIADSSGGGDYQCFTISYVPYPPEYKPPPFQQYRHGPDWGGGLY